MTFSIATPVRNGLAALKRCAGSVRAQRGVPHQHLVQDGLSEDGTSEWLARQPDIDSETRPDNGMYAAINRAWDRASGDVLSWLNADEQYLPGTLERVASAFATHPAVDAVWGNAIVVSPDGHPLAARRDIPLRRLYVANGVLYAFSCTLFFRRSLRVSGVLACDESYRVCGDADLVLRLLEAGTTFLHLKTYLSLFEWSGANLTSSRRALMLEETERLRDTHGSLAPCGRAVVRVLRCAERMLSGCWLPDRIDYDYCLDEVPTVVRRSGTRVGFRFSARPPRG